MDPRGLVVCLFVLVVAALATDVLQCPGKSIEELQSRVQLSPCKKPPCRLKKGTDQHITINFSTDKEIADVKNHVVAKVFGVPISFIGVDGMSVCEKIYTESGEKADCPLKANSKYIYKDSFHVHSFYPSIHVNVHWALQSGLKDIICFEVPARIS